MDYLAAALNLLRPNPDWEVAEIYVYIRPIGKGRPRDNWHTPSSTREWESKVRGTAVNIMAGRPVINFPVAAKVLFGLHKNRADTDNLEKIVWDAFQPVVITDDKFVRGHIEKGEEEVERASEFVWAKFYARREEDYLNYIAQLDMLEEPRDLGF